MNRLVIVAMILAAAAPVVASSEDDMTSLSYISYLERYATIEPATADDSIEAVTNMPLVIGDRVDTAREARLEIVLADGSVLWLDQYTTISLDAVAYSRDVGSERTVIFLVDGRMMIQVPEHVLATEPLRIDSSNATVYLNQAGLYRLEVLRSGGLRVEVWEGLAEAATVAGGVLVEPSTAAEVRSGEVAGVEPHLTWGDDFAQWVEQRQSVYQGESSQHVDERFARSSAALDSYGTWVYVDASQSWAWQPAVGPDWRPYTAGRWYWTPTGWSWISYEPWGWLPYHYGTWNYTASYGWVWGWGSVWSPAWVSWCYWPGYVSWCPWGYYNSWCWGRYPGWGWGSTPVHPYPPGGGHPRPPRGSVVPPRDGAIPVDSGRRQTPDARLRAAADEPGAGRRTTPSDAGAASATGRRAAADFTGHVRVAEMDRTGWNVVPVEDFSSRHLSRVVQPGSRVMAQDRDARGVVVTGPLTTRSPSQAAASREISRTFADVGARVDRDITRVMARDESLRREDVDRLVQPISLSNLGRSSAQTVVATQDEASVPRRATDGSGRPTLSAASGSPFSPQAPDRVVSSRRSTGNLYRPGGSAVSDAGQRTPVTAPSRTTATIPPTRSATRAGDRYVPRTRPSSTLPSVRGSASAPRSRSSVILPRTRSSSSLPSTRSSSSPLVRQPVSPRVGGGRPSSATSSSRPVIVPRTAPTRPSRSLGSSSSSSRSPSIRVAPSGRSSSPSVRPSSRSSSGSAGKRSSGSVRSGGGSSRPSSSGSKSHRR